MDTVLGVSMAPTAVRMVLVEGQNGDGALVDEDKFDVTVDEDSATTNAAEQVISAILGTREGAAEGGYELASTGVTWRDPAQAAELRDALAHRKVENVMLVSAFLAAAALAQSVGNETDYAETALLFIEPDTATLAVVNSFDGSIADIHRQPLPEDDDAAVAKLTELVSAAEDLPQHPDAMFVVGSGVDLPLIKPVLEAATTLPVTTAEEPETALARGAALAAANTPLLVSSTAAQAYAQVHGTGAMNPYALDAAYFDDVSHKVDTGEALAYSAVPDEQTEAQPGFVEQEERKPFAFLGSILAGIFVVGVAALVVSLAVSIRSTSGTRPDPGQNAVVPPSLQAPAPTPQAPAPTPQAPAPTPQAPAPTPQAPAAVPEEPANVPQGPVNVPQAPAPAPVEVPQAPAPVPAPAPAAPIPVPVPVPIPDIFNPPGPGLPGIGGPGGGRPGRGPDVKIPGGGGKGPGGGHGGGRGGGHGGGRGGGFNIPGIPGI
ncbi:DUF7159 family protein [Mycobacterium intermedium]